MASKFRYLWRRHAKAIVFALGSAASIAAIVAFLVTFPSHFPGLTVSQMAAPAPHPTPIPSPAPPPDALLTWEIMMAGQFKIVPPGSVVWDNIHVWDYAFGVEYYGQGDDGHPEKKIEWHACAATTGRWAREECSKSPEYRRDHPVHWRDWHG
jgi:hypothetical protein